MGANQSSDAVVDLSVKVEEKETVKIEQPVNDEKQTKSTPQEDEMSSAMAYRTRIMSSEQQQHEQHHEQEMRAHAAVHRPRLYLHPAPRRSKNPSLQGRRLDRLERLGTRTGSPLTSGARRSA
jgi:hypothetical protein